MDTALFPESGIWTQIDLSESYMVCGMFEGAALRAASVVKRIRKEANSMEGFDGADIGEMMESAGMVYVQSLKELGRTRELIYELKVLFGSVAAIPVQVFLAGSCMQISEGYSSNLKPNFEEFLEKWAYLKDEENVLPKAELQSSSSEGCIWQPFIPVDKYLEVADIYAITILAISLKHHKLAISWIEKAGLPEEKRQDMLRRLHSLQASNSRSSSTGTVPTKDRNENLYISGTGSAASIGENLHNKDRFKFGTPKSKKPSATLKFGNFQLVLPRGKVIFWSSLILFTFYFLRKKRAVLMRIITRQASSIRKALIDAWQLAFSVQVNPLAAVQQLPSSAPRGSR